MNTRTFPAFCIWIFLFFLPSSLILSSTLCLAQVDLNPVNDTSQNAAGFTDDEVWEERMRRIWGMGSNSFKDGECGKNLDCPSIAEDIGGTSTKGSISVHHSQVKGSVVNQSRDDHRGNAATGPGANATRGSITLRGARMNGRIANRSHVEQSANQAFGRGATATMGSITIEDSNFQGRMSNQSEVEQSINQASGRGATATMGSITVE